MKTINLELALHEMKEHEFLYFMAKILEELTKRNKDKSK